METPPSRHTPMSRFGEAGPDYPDRQAQLVRLMLAILGAFLLVYGWYQWAA